MSSSPSHGSQAPEASQAASPFSSDASSSGFPTDKSKPPTSKGPNTAEQIIHKGAENYKRVCRATKDGSEAKPQFVELWQWDGEDLPGGGECTIYFYSDDEIEEVEDKLGPWIDPLTGLGDTVEATFRRPVGSEGEFAVIMTDRKKT